MCLLSLLVCFLFEVLGNTFTRFVTLLHCVTSLSFSSLLTMKDQTKNWAELSLSDREHTSFVLPKIHKSREYIIAAKIFNFVLSRYGGSDLYFSTKMEVDEWL